MKTVIRKYYWLTKPGIIYGNLLTVLGGYLFGAARDVSWPVLVSVMAGSAFIIASGCVINNISDRHIDSHMKRTKKRALVTGNVSVKNAVVYAAVLALVGINLLFWFTNSLTVVLGVIGLITYAGIYTYAKPRTVYATLIGTVPGAIPPLAGYVAASNQITISFWVIFFLMASWQMVHFYAIAIFRRKEYAAAKVPVMPLVNGLLVTKLHMIMYGMVFILAVVSLAMIGGAGLTYLVIMSPLALWWLTIIIQGLEAKETDKWARKVFSTSLLLLPAFCFTLALNAWTL